MRCKINRYIFIMCIIFSFIMSISVVFAEDGINNTVVNDQGVVTEQIPDGYFQLTLCLSSDFAGKTLNIKNTSTGENLENILIDSTGTGTAVVPVQSLISVALSTDTPSPNQTKKSEWSPSIPELLFFSFIAVCLSAFIFYQVGKKKTMKKFDAAWDIIYNEELDD